MQQMERSLALSFHYHFPGIHFSIRLFYFISKRERRPKSNGLSLQEPFPLSLTESI